MKGKETYRSSENCADKAGTKEPKRDLHIGAVFSSTDNTEMQDSCEPSSFHGSLSVVAKTRCTCHVDQLEIKYLRYTMKGDSNS